MLKHAIEIYKYRELLVSLVSKDLNARYKGSFLGFLWTFVNPIMQLIIYSVVFTYIFKIQQPNYAMFLFVALLPWTGFITALSGSLGCVVGNASLVKKIYFPRLILPISISLTYMVDYMYCLPILFLVMAICKIPFTIYLLFLPLLILIQLIYKTGLCFIFSAMNVRFRDMQQIVGILTMAWF